jgi:tetratricopeptide (TPR) repeat protein
MKSTLDRLISKAERLAEADDNDGAMFLATKLINEHPKEMKVWLLRSYLHGRSGDYDQAIADVTCAIRIDPEQPSIGKDEDAVEDCTKGLRLCDQYGNDYYREALHFMRAESLLRLGKKPQALADLTHVRDDYTLWTDRLRTKADLVADCKDLQL